MASRASIRRSVAGPRLKAASAIADNETEVSAGFLQHCLHLQCGGGETLAGRAKARDTFLEETQRFVELQVFGFELPHDLFQAGELGGQGSGVGGVLRAWHYDSTRA